MCGELLIFGTNQQFATHRLKVEMDGAAKVELLRCDYAARCPRSGCRQYRGDHDHPLRAQPGPPTTAIRGLR